MAGSGAAYATGANNQADDLRRRNVPSVEINGQPQKLVHEKDDKKLQTVRPPQSSRHRPDAQVRLALQAHINLSV